MYQRSENGLSERSVVNSGNFTRPTVSNHTQVRVMLILSTALDCESLPALLKQRPEIGDVECSADLEFGLARAHRVRPQVLVVDPMSGKDFIQRLASHVCDQGLRNVVLLDDRVHEARLARILSLPGVSYLTRNMGLNDFCRGLVKVGTMGERVFDPSIADRVQRTPHGLRLQESKGHPSVATLTSRELEVMELLAKGRSVRDCAEQMNLAESTIDNHKSRLMKKLRIHKAAQLTHLAIRDGVITV